MTTNKDYQPAQGSIPARVIAFFQANPDEELTLEDIAEKFDVVRNNIHTNLSLAVSAGAVVLMVTDEQKITYNDDIALVRNHLMQTMGVDDKALTKAATKAVRDEFSDEAKELQALIDAQKKPAAPGKPPVPNAPLAQPNLAPGSATKGVKKSKLSAQDAISGIAAAMQGAGEAASAPEGAVALPATTLAVGVPVKIASELSNPHQQKYAGKNGTITGKVGSAWDVTFKGRTGGISSFTADQLTVVAA